MAVLPIESDAFPKLASSVNAALEAARVAPIEEYLPLKVSLEVVQLQAECVDKNEYCFAAAGRSLDVNYLLAAEVAQQKKKGKGLQVTVLLFHVDKTTTLKLLEKTFQSEDEAVRSVKGMVDEVVLAAPPAADAGR